MLLYVAFYLITMAVYISNNSSPSRVGRELSRGEKAKCQGIDCEEGYICDRSLRNTMILLNSTNQEPKCQCVDCEEDKKCGGLWRGNQYPYPGSRIGNTPNGSSYVDPCFDENAYLLKKKIHLVISHCTANLNWISYFTKGFDISSIHVVTKCGKEVEGAPTSATIEKMPNVGRCDHTYAHYITTIMDQKVKKGEESDSIVVFLKDDMSPANIKKINMEWSQLDAMVRTASSENGFACGSFSLNNKISAYAYRNQLFKFTIKSYNPKLHAAKGYNSTGSEFRGKYINVGDFYRSIPGHQRPPKFVQTCFGGVFAASVPSIKKRDMDFWAHIERVLSRGDNIEEGHYAERTWASFLAKPLEPYQVEGLKKYYTRTKVFGSKVGILLHAYEKK
jgi:hypothetical protein